MKALCLFFGGIFLVFLMQAVPKASSVVILTEGKDSILGGQNQCSQTGAFFNECAGCPNDICAKHGTVCRKAIVSKLNACHASTGYVNGHYYDCKYETIGESCGKYKIGELQGGGRCKLDGCGIEGSSCGNDKGKLTVVECAIKSS